MKMKICADLLVLIAFVDSPLNEAGGATVLLLDEDDGGGRCDVPNCLQSFKALSYLEMFLLELNINYEMMKTYIDSTERASEFKRIATHKRDRCKCVETHTHTYTHMY